MAQVQVSICECGCLGLAQLFLMCEIVFTYESCEIACFCTAGEYYMFRCHLLYESEWKIQRKAGGRKKCISGNILQHPSYQIGVRLGRSVGNMLLDSQVNCTCHFFKIEFSHYTKSFFSILVLAVLKNNPTITLKGYIMALFKMEKVPRAVVLSSLN